MVACIWGMQKLVSSKHQRRQAQVTCMRLQRASHALLTLSPPQDAKTLAQLALRKLKHTQYIGCWWSSLMLHCIQMHQ